MVFMILGFPGGSDGKAYAYSAGHPVSIPGSRRYPGEGNGHETLKIFTSLITVGGKSSRCHQWLTMNLKGIMFYSNQY